MKNGKAFTHKKKSLFEQAQENQDIKKEPVGFLWNPQSEFTSDEGKEQVSRLLPLDTLHPEDYGGAAGGFAEQSA